MANDILETSELSRRRLLGLLAASAASGVVSTRRGHAAPQANDARGNKPTIPKGAIIRTILKDLRPEELTGTILFHEHIGSSPDVDVVVEEVEYAGTKGVSCIVDGGHPDMRRKLENLRAIATRTKVNIVASGGYYTQRTYPPEIATKTEDEIATDLAQEARRDRLGAFGEIGQIPNASDFTRDERKVFRAVGKAHVLANLPVFTHNAYGTGPNVPREAGLRQLDVFESVGVDPGRVAIGHVCCLDDSSADIMKQIAKRGAFVGFDRMEDVHPHRPGAENVVVDVPDAQRVRMILAFLDAGYVDHLLLSADCTGQPIKLDEEVNQMVADGWLASGDGKKIKAILEDSMGYMRTLSGFVPKLRVAGVNEATLRTILQDNPRRFLAFVPKQSA